MRRRARTRGFTVVEVVLSAALMAGILLVLGSSLAETTKQTAYDVAYGEASAELRKILSLVARELPDSGAQEGGTDYVVAPTRNSSNSGTNPRLSFQRRIDVTTTPANDWRPVRTIYEVVASPGETAGNAVDDDRDGLVDEQTLQRREITVAGGAAFGPTVVLSESVTQLRVDRAAGSDLVTVVVQVGRGYHGNGKNEPVLVRGATNVLLRNR